MSLFPFWFRALELILSLTEETDPHRLPPSYRHRCMLRRAKLILKCALWYSSGDLTQIELFSIGKRYSYIQHREISENKRNNNSKLRTKSARKKFGQKKTDTFYRDFILKRKNDSFLTKITKNIEEEKSIFGRKKSILSKMSSRSLSRVARSGQIRSKHYAKKTAGRGGGPKKS